VLACASEEIPTGSAWQFLAGFPVCYESGAGFFAEGPQNGMKLGSVDTDADLEIIFAATATPGNQSIFIFNPNGDELSNWPPASFPSASAPFVLGRFSASTIGDGIFAGTNTASTNYLAAATLDEGVLSGWPRQAGNYVGAYPAAFDADGDGIDEIFTDEENGTLNIYRANGEPSPTSPNVRQLCTDAGVDGGQQVGGFAFGDLDGDGDTDIVAISRSPRGQDFSCLVAIGMDGSLLSGFPVSIRGPRRNATLTIGDVDGDASLEIIYVNDLPASPEVYVFSGDGAVERVIQLAGQISFSAPASSLADLDGDGTPEIIVLAEGTLNVVRGDGTAFAGYPVEFSPETSGGAVPLLTECGVVVGDIDGDQSPDLVFCARTNGNVELWAANVNGEFLPNVPLILSRNGSNPRGPAIGDIDGDGQNEIVIASYETLWVLRYGSTSPSGEVLWGQWGRDSRSSAKYP
jgi:hypothetical protein